MNNSSQAQIIDGTTIALAIREELKTKVVRLADKPGLAIILVGSDPASYVYVGLKEQAAQEAGIHFEKDYYPSEVGEQIVLSKISELNSRPDINGILVQLPLPKGFDENKIVAAIKPNKDVDGFHPENIKALLAGQQLIIPGLSAGIVRLIASTGSTQNKRAAIVAKSGVFSQPLTWLLQQSGAHVTVRHPDSPDCLATIQLADIIVVAIGRPRWLKAEMIKEGAIVIDVGYNRVNNKAVGDVDFEAVSQKAGWITPVPGGVGPMTVAMLLTNVLKAYEIQKP